ncbi:hypothetical protein [Phormidium tenue]|uniref:hypothetical protein n=1 Tax=Phormidium tenue TaxID=126344 RepID=UPI0030DA8226
MKNLRFSDRLSSITIAPVAVLLRLLWLHIIHDDASMSLLAQPLTVVKFLTYLKHYEVIAISKVVKTRMAWILKVLLVQKYYRR